jgi:hypothetical protein
MASHDVISVVSFVVLAGLWFAFAVALVSSRWSLDATWRTVAALPLPLKGVAGLLTLPVMLGLALWEGAWRTGTWPLVLRLLLVAGLAVATLNAFLPRGIT